MHETKFLFDTGEKTHQLEYIEAIGSLHYALTIMRINLLYATSRLTNYLKNPTITHLIRVKKKNLFHLKGMMNK